MDRHETFFNSFYIGLISISNNIAVCDDELQIQLFHMREWERKRCRAFSNRNRRQKKKSIVVGRIEAIFKWKYAGYNALSDVSSNSSKYPLIRLYHIKCVSNVRPNLNFWNWSSKRRRRIKSADEAEALDMPFDDGARRFFISCNRVFIILFLVITQLNSWVSSLIRHLCIPNRLEDYEENHVLLTAAICYSYRWQIVLLHT